MCFPGTVLFSRPTVSAIKKLCPCKFVRVPVCVCVCMCVCECAFQFGTNVRKYLPQTHHCRAEWSRLTHIERPSFLLDARDSAEQFCELPLHVSAHEAAERDAKS